jgi:hypothetical protein
MTSRTYDAAALRREKTRDWLTAERDIRFAGLGFGKIVSDPSNNFVLFRSESSSSYFNSELAQPV